MLTNLTTDSTQSQFCQTRQVERGSVQCCTTSQLVNGEELTNSEVTTLVGRYEEYLTRTECVSLITLNDLSFVNIRIVGFSLVTSTNTQEVVTCQADLRELSSNSDGRTCARDVTGVRRTLTLLWRDCQSSTVIVGVCKTNSVSVSYRSRDVSNCVDNVEQGVSTIGSRESDCVTYERNLIVSIDLKDCTLLTRDGRCCSSNSEGTTVRRARIELVCVYKFTIDEWRCTNCNVTVRRIAV